ncbi:PREDICTED: radial spoke head protein 4 homolog A-like [Priapulus caudatus]|uniref:Radial spoke head protein 4 homolog A-like n=1 Tax=Priapulus caudatus TaxID=37621 RepID=A0ABM1EMV9_PRICU|nr:PREDICTED: radial spoke head protein 4 homolog A-like [Priapulus caudatus]
MSGQVQEEDFVNAKAYLLQSNLYDHLCKVLTKVLDERPKNAGDSFEDISKDVKKTAFNPESDVLQDKNEDSTEVEIAETHKKLFTKPDELELHDGHDDELGAPLGNLMESAFMFEQAGIGFSREETYRIFLALKQLLETQPIQHIRFWGKILGVQQSYIVAEAEPRDGEDIEPIEKDDVEEGNGERDSDAGGDDQDDDAIPKPDYNPSPVIPREENGVGCNKKIYFVCTEPGMPWTRLPPVTPAQMVAARMIRKLFTGHLDAPVNSYPVFPGNEANYLRAQIARISAATQISPLGFYHFDEEEEEQEETDARDTYVENLEFEPIPVKDLADSNMANWVHHVQHILPQGRCKWYNPFKKDSEELDEENFDDEAEETDAPIPEAGPPLLTPLAEDAEIAHIAPWSTQLSSNYFPQFALAVVRSNLWPGAATVAAGRKFENIYIGVGHKYSLYNYSPPAMPPVGQEHPMMEELTEIEDPSVEEEAAFKAAQQEAEERAEEEAEAEEDGDEDEN